MSGQRTRPTLLAFAARLTQWNWVSAMIMPKRTAQTAGASSSSQRGFLRSIAAACHHVIQWTRSFQRKICEHLPALKKGINYGNASTTSQGGSLCFLAVGVLLLLLCAGAVGARTGFWRATSRQLPSSRRWERTYNAGFSPRKRTAWPCCATIRASFPIGASGTMDVRLAPTEPLPKMSRPELGWVEGIHFQPVPEVMNVNSELPTISS